MSIQLTSVGLAHVCPNKVDKKRTTKQKMYTGLQQDTKLRWQFNLAK